MSKSGEEAVATSSLRMTPVTLSAGMTENPMVRIRPTPDSGPLPLTRQNMFLQEQILL